MKIIKILLTTVVSLVSLVATVAMLLVLLCAGSGGGKSQGIQEAALMDRYDMYITNQISSALEGVLSIQKVYWLNDADLIAPEPDPEKFGNTADPSTLQWLLDDAQFLLEGQNTLFSTDVTILPGSEVVYYLDETIFCVTWKQAIGGAVYTFSEVKIAHPSQFRRFLADGTYGSDKQYLTTQMAASVNAVTASNADFYKFRPYGVVVYNGEVCRVNGAVDTCFIDTQGELHFVRRGEITDWETAEKFVQDHNIRFSLAFGPVLIEDGKNVVPPTYPLGEINGVYSRAALCQMDRLHYVLVVAGYDAGYQWMPASRQFADQLVKMGIPKAYGLDGGQTGAIVTNDVLINHPDFGSQRLVSDIIYFATAVPDGGE